MYKLIPFLFLIPYVFAQHPHPNFRFEQDLNNPRTFYTFWEYGGLEIITYSELEYTLYTSELAIQAGIGEVIKTETFHGFASLLDTDFLVMQSSFTLPDFDHEVYLGVRLRSFRSRYDFPQEVILETKPSVSPFKENFFLVPAVVCQVGVPMEILTDIDNLKYVSSILNSQEIINSFEPQNPIFSLSIIFEGIELSDTLSFEGIFQGTLPSGEYTFVFQTILNSQVISNESYEIVIEERNNTLVLERVSSVKGFETVVAFQRFEEDTITYLKLYSDGFVSNKAIRIPSHSKEHLFVVNLKDVFPNLSGVLEVYTLPIEDFRKYGPPVFARARLSSTGSPNNAWFTGFHRHNYNPLNQEVTIIPDTSKPQLSKYDGMWIAITNKELLEEEFVVLFDGKPTRPNVYVGGESYQYIHIVSKPTNIVFEGESGHAGFQYGWLELVFPQILEQDASSIRIEGTREGIDFYYTSLEVRGGEVSPQTSILKGGKN